MTKEGTPFKILCAEPDPALPEDIAVFFPEASSPGTNFLSERKRNPGLFSDGLDYDTWVRKQSLSSFKELHETGAVDEAEPEAIAKKIADIFEQKLPWGKSLCEETPQQIYQDIFNRTILHLSGKIDHQAHLYKEFNHVCHLAAINLIRELDDENSVNHIRKEGQVDIYRLVQLAVLSGYTGINLKSSASAASNIFNVNDIPVDKKLLEMSGSMTAEHPEIKRIIRQLLEVSKRPNRQLELSGLPQYMSEVAFSKKPVLLVFWPDDYFESLIDLKRFELLLEGNHHLTVLFVPRFGRYGNDLAFEDMEQVLREPEFSGIKRFIGERFFISGNGPRCGCIDPRFISAGLISEIRRLGERRKIVFETKGCRNFEMVKGCLKVPWYPSFNVNRELSVRTLGISGPPVFLRIPPGLPAFDGFTNPKIQRIDGYDGGDVMLANFTTIDLFRLTRTAQYNEYLSRHADEYEANLRLRYQTPELVIEN